MRARAGALHQPRQGQPLKQIALREGVGINVEEDDVGKLQAFGVVHRHHCHRALRGGAAASTDGYVVLTQLAGDLLAALVGTGKYADGDVFYALGPVLNVRSQHCGFLRFGLRMQHNRCWALAY